MVGLSQPGWLKFAIAVVALGACLLQLPRAAHAEAAVSSVGAGRAIEAPVLDGIFDDPCWVGAPPVTGFVESGPEAGAQPAFATDLRLAVDADALYLAFRAHTGDPAQLVTTVMQRDGGILRSDDYFIFGLDTFHDHRDAYYFMVNAAGVQADGRIVDEGVTIDSNWDGTWRVVTREQEDGWSAEIAIPLRDLNFHETDDGTWGFVAFASSRARQRFVSWPDLRAGGTRVSRYGHLTELVELDGRRPLAMLPYLSNGSSLPHTELEDGVQRQRPASWERAIGLDLQMQPTPGTSLSLALNPDFAAVESDQFVFNLTVDELFLPERRPFFVEGTDLFSTPTRLLYTRRIGVDEEIVAGAKLRGRTGDGATWGVLSATTGNGFDAGHQYTAARLKRGILGSSSVGLLLVSKDRLRGGLASVNRAGGIDLNWQVSKSTRVVFTHSRSQRPGEGGNGAESTVDARYNGNLFGPRHWLFLRATVEDVTPGFDLDDIGYMPGSRIDRRGASGRLRYAWKPSGRLREIAIMPVAWRYRDHTGQLRTQDGASLELSAMTAGRVRPSLLLVRGYFLDRDDNTGYDNTQRTLALGFGPYPRIGGKMSWREGRNFGADIRYLQAELTAKAAANLSFTAMAFRLHSDPDDEPASRDLIGVAGLDWRVSAKLYLRWMLQGDTGSDRALTSGLLRYDFAPGSTLYLSFRESRLGVDERVVTEDRVLLGKVSWRVGS
jgi:hypothetical protein